MMKTLLMKIRLLDTTMANIEVDPCNKENITPRLKRNSYMDITTFVQLQENTCQNMNQKTLLYQQDMDLICLNAPKLRNLQTKMLNSQIDTTNFVSLQENAHVKHKTLLYEQDMDITCFNPTVQRGTKPMCGNMDLDTSISNSQGMVESDKSMELTLINETRAKAILETNIKLTTFTPDNHKQQINNFTSVEIAMKVNQKLKKSNPTVQKLSHVEPTTSNLNESNIKNLPFKYPKVTTTQEHLHSTNVITSYTDASMIDFKTCASSTVIDFNNTKSKVNSEKS